MAGWMQIKVNAVLRIAYCNQKVGWPAVNWRWSGKRKYEAWIYSEIFGEKVFWFVSATSVVCVPLFSHFLIALSNPLNGFFDIPKPGNIVSKPRVKMPSHLTQLKKQWFNRFCMNFLTKSQVFTSFTNFKLK